MQNQGKLFIPQQKTVLVVIDIQEKLLPAVNNYESVLNESLRAINIAQELDIPVVLTEQLPDKIGHTIKQVKDVINPFEVIIKSAFSCFGEAGFAKALNKIDAKHLILCGIESHVCVLQTGLDALAGDYETYILTNATGSRKDTDRDFAFERFTNYGGELITVEMMAFELIKDSLHEKFRNVSKLVK